MATLTDTSNTFLKSIKPNLTGLRDVTTKVEGHPGYAPPSLTLTSNILLQNVSVPPLTCSTGKSIANTATSSPKLNFSGPGYLADQSCSSFAPLVTKGSVSGLDAHDPKKEKKGVARFTSGMVGIHVYNMYNKSHLVVCMLCVCIG